MVTFRPPSTRMASPRASSGRAPSAVPSSVAPAKSTVTSSPRTMTRGESSDAGARSRYALGTSRTGRVMTSPGLSTSAGACALANVPPATTGTRDRSIASGRASKDNLSRSGNGEPRPMAHTVIMCSTPARTAKSALLQRPGLPIVQSRHAYCSVRGPVSPMTAAVAPENDFWTVDERTLAEFTSRIEEPPSSLLWAAIRREAERIALAPGFDRLITLDANTIKELPHQIDVAQRVLRDMGGRAILADEVGLGKTIEASIVYKELAVRGLARRALILTPASP